MPPEARRRAIISLLLALMLMALVVLLHGLATSLQLGDAERRGFLLVPALSTPQYATMLLVMLFGVGLSLLASILQRRKGRRGPEQPRESAAPKPFWQAMLSTLAWLVIIGLGLNWLMRHGQQVQEFLTRVQVQIGTMRDLLTSGSHPIVDQVSSPTAGYGLVAMVTVIYGGIALMALWVLLEERGWGRPSTAASDPRVREVRQAMQAGLRELREQTDPRQAIIACYARLEHLLADHGVQSQQHLTPQEYMTAALRGLDLPLDALSGLTQLFELARYSLHPLDDQARAAARDYLERLTSHLEGETVHVARV